MGLKEKMADAMMGKMDAAEKQEMMSAMMDKFFSEMSGAEKQKIMEAMMGKFMAGLSPEEKQNMMKSMMPKMMGAAEGEPGMMNMMEIMMGNKNPMKEMMSGMMSNCCGDEGEGEMPWDMCKKMMATIGKSSELATFATPEVRGLFEEWAGQIEAEILGFIKESGASDPQKIADQFKLSKDSVHYFLNRLAQKGKITLKAENMA